MGRRSSDAENRLDPVAALLEQPQRPDPETLGFEAAGRLLDRILTALEADELPLESALAYYEFGVALSARIRALIGAAERRIEQLTTAGEQPLDPAGDGS